MAVVRIWTALEWDGNDGDRTASLQYTLVAEGPGRQHGWRKTVDLDGPGSGLNVISEVTAIQIDAWVEPSQRVRPRAMFTGSPRTRVEALNEAPARASRWRGMRRRSKR